MMKDFIIKVLKSIWVLKYLILIVIVAWLGTYLIDKYNL